MAKRMINILLSLMMVFALVGTNTGFSVKAEEKAFGPGVVLRNGDIVNFGDSVVKVATGSAQQNVKGRYRLSVDSNTTYTYRFTAENGQNPLSFPVDITIPSDAPEPEGIIASGVGSDAEPYTLSAYYYASGLNLNQSSLTLVKGEQETLTATVLPEYANDKTVTWSSDKTNVATVDETGAVTAVGAGEATITATTSNGINTSCTVTVNGKPVTGISLNKNSMTLSVNSQGAIAITDIQPNDADNKTVTWVSSDDNVVSIMEQKEDYVVVSGLSEGTATITATASSGISATCTVNVTNESGPDIGIGTTWKNGEPISLNGKYFIYDDTDTNLRVPGTNWGQVTNPVYLDTTNQWRFENVFRDVIFDGAPNPMSVHILIGVSEGKSSGDKPSGFKIASGEGTDTNPYKFKLVYDVTGITLNKESTPILEGNTDTLTATVLPESADNITVTWSSDTPGVATVDENGVVTGVKAGTATITATATNGTDDTEDDKTAKCKVTVKAADVKEYDLWVGGTRVTSSNKDDVLGDGTVSFDPERNILTLNNASISNSSYGIKAEGIDLIINAIGENTVNVDYDGIKVTGKLSITGGTITSHGANRGIYADSLEVSGGTVTASGGKHGIEGKSLTFSGGKVIATASSGSAVKAENISIDDSCKITKPVGGEICGETGNMWIGTSGSIAQEVVIDSAAAPVSEYTITISDSIQHGTVASDVEKAKAGDTVTLTVTPAEGYELDSITVTDNKGASIELTKVDDTTYSFTMPAANVTVTGTFEKIPGPEKVDVTGITVNPTEITIDISSADTNQITAVVDPNTADDKTVVWSSDKPTVARVESNGVITAVADGTATITATATNGTEDTSDDKTASCVVTVTNILDHAASITKNGQTIYYINFSDALSDWYGEGTAILTILKDINYSEAIALDSGKTVILDLNGHNLTLNKNISVNYGANLSIKDSSGSGTITSSANNGTIVVSSSDSSLTLESGTITNSYTTGGESAGQGVLVSRGTFTMTGGTITGCGTAGVNVVSGTFNVSGNPQITGNGTVTSIPDAQHGNVLLAPDKVINIAGELDESVKIGVTTVKKPSESEPEITLTSGLEGNGTIANFVSEDSSYQVKLSSSSNEAVLALASKTVASVTTVDGTTTEYDDFTAAFNDWNSAEDGAVLKLLKDITITTSKTISSGTKTFDLNGYGLRQGGTFSGQNLGILSITGGNITITDSDPSKTHYISTDEKGRGIAVSDTVPEGDYISVSGGYLTGAAGESNATGAISLTGGTLTLQGGTIAGNAKYASYATRGGGIYVNGSDTILNVENGTISNNTASFGGGIFMDRNAGLVNITGGTITGNTATTTGGAICIEGGTVNMSGGSVTDNTGENCGGIDIFLESSALRLSGGSITNNNAVRTDTSYASSMGAGIRFENGTFILTFEPGNEAPVISGNKQEYNGTVSDSNIYVEPGKEITIGGVSDSSVYGISTASGLGSGEVRVFGNAGSSTYLDHFIADDPKLGVTYTDGKLAFARFYTVTIGTITGGTVTADKERTTANNKVTLTVTPEEGNYISRVSYIDVYGESKNINPIAGEYAFSMPARDTTVTATFQQKRAISPIVSLTGWTYGSDANEPAVTGNDGSGTVTYKYKVKDADDSTYSTDVPTDAGEYTIKAEIAETDRYLSGSATADFTISKAALTITAKDKTITYGDAPANDGVTYTGFVGDDTEDTALAGTLEYTYSYSQFDNVGDYTITPGGVTAGNYNITFTVGMLKVDKKPLTFTWSETSSFEYDGDSHTVTATAETVNSDVLDIAYTDNEKTNAGSYTAKVTGVSGDKADNYAFDSSDSTASKQWTITKATPVVTAPTAKTLSYTGAAQELVNAGSTNSGTMKYSLSESGPYSTALPMATDAGSYTVYYKVEGDKNHADVAPQSISVTVAKKPAPESVTDSQKPTAKTGLVYNGTAQELVNAPKSVPAGYSLKYSVDGKTWASDIPTGTLPGDYTVKVKYEGDSNHESFDGDDLKVSVANGYIVYSGNNQTWQKGSTNSIEIVFKAGANDNETFNKWDKVITIDGRTVAAASYTARSGSLVVDLKPAYLETLTIGSHTMIVKFSDGSASAVLTIKDKPTSGGGSSDKKPATPVDNVVTCQMAGYPSNYSWNESAKACQPGYIDAGGNFHPYSTPHSRGVIPNTGDKDLTVYAWIAMLAMTLAMYCGVRLLREDWEV